MIVKTLLISCSVLLATGLAAAPPGRSKRPGPGMEFNTNRNGGDYKDFELDTPSPKLCMDACQGEADCKAWTYVKPGVQGDKAHCWLKDGVPEPAPDENCVSGVKRAGGGGAGGGGGIVAGSTMERNINRNGGDYKDFEVDTPDPKLCMAACVKEAACKAWTYVKPGVQGDKAHCWLKDGVPEPAPDENCVSGVKKR